MDWALQEELKDCLVAAAPYGGPIGMFLLCYYYLPWAPGGLLSGCSLPIHLLNILNLGSHEVQFPWAEPG